MSRKNLTFAGRHGILEEVAKSTQTPGETMIPTVSEGVANSIAEQSNRDEKYSIEAVENFREKQPELAAILSHYARILSKDDQTLQARIIKLNVLIYKMLEEQVLCEELERLF